MDKIIIANWKMNPQTLKDAESLFAGIKKTALTTRNVDTVIAPPSVFLHSLASSSKAKRIQFAAQNIHFAESGAQVGELSAKQVKDIGATHVLIGHSARRATGETDEEIAQKVMAALSNKLLPVVFLGETERDAQGQFLHTVRKQITLALGNIPASRIKDVILVYEPVWAISTAEDAKEISLNEIHQMIIFVLKVLTESFGAIVARKVKILYGGSVNSANAEKILEIPGVAGAAVGGASLDATEFGSILQAANKA